MTKALAQQNQGSEFNSQSPLPKVSKIQFKLVNHFENLSSPSYLPSAFLVLILYILNNFTSHLHILRFYR